MKFFDSETIRSVLPMQEAIEAVAWAYRALSKGACIVPDRLHLSQPFREAHTLVMPAYVPADDSGRFPEALAVKVVSVIPGNGALGKETVMGVVNVLDPATGECLAVMDGGALTALRTGAGAGVATRILARPDAEVLAVFGAGAQAAALIDAVRRVRAIRSIRIVNRTLASATSLRDRVAANLGDSTEISVVATVAEALRDADVICTATGAIDALFLDRDIMPGAHINAIGAFRPDMQEVPPETVRRSRIFVDYQPAALREAGDLVRAGITKVEIAGEIGALLEGNCLGRTSATEITMFKSVGVAVQDAVCAAAVLQAAPTRG